MVKSLTCVACPIGCALSAQIEEGEVTGVSGNACRRGESYAKTECIAPVRSLTTTVRARGGAYPLVSVRSAAPLPKEKLFDCMALINKTLVDAPVEIGDVVIPDILGTGVNIIATNQLVRGAT